MSQCESMESMGSDSIDFSLRIPLWLCPLRYNLNQLNCAITNVGAVLHAVELDAVDVLVGGGLCLFEGGRECGDAEDAAAAGEGLLKFAGGACVEGDAVECVGGCTDDVACAWGGGVVVGGEDDADGDFVAPVEGGLVECAACAVVEDVK